MRKNLVINFIFISVTLSSCSSFPDSEIQSKENSATLPLDVGNGIGSQFGNYPAQPEGEARGPLGERCVVVNWDRPLTKELALRLQSVSCDSKDLPPGKMAAREISRTVIPLSESNVKY
ncbi:hypothetical protein [Magnetospirillum molischianum]|uniref:Uncharacterized protein n=1 Tax=Magnetospirillum molischianum DSM 120 TaxID=1150626 RepID=H8FQ44_MAGML|nr:hypothetical protein [Magnetospirillum molischianum]CCG40482.1 exported hypothetical protein [Magnetospirillum molischianum DSM 120]